MADHADDGGDNDVFVYMGGLIPEHLRETITHVRIHESVKIIRRSAFQYCRNLLSVEMHDGVEIIEEYAFRHCRSLRRIKLPGVRVIRKMAFDKCTALESVEFGDELESIGQRAFNGTNLTTINLSKFRFIRVCAFANCERLTELELSKDLKTIGEDALKAGMFDDGVFDGCDALSRVNLVGGIHKTISSLLIDSWRNEMNDEIDRINQDLPNTDSYEKTALIGQWMRSVLERITHYKSEHFILLKEFTTLIELALWKSKLDESQDERALGSDQPAKKAKIDMEAVRQEKRITSGASIVIKNVLPFLKLE